MNMIKCLKLLTILLISFSVVNFVSAQAGRGKGRLRGAIKNEAGEPVENAQIEVSSRQFPGTVFEATSDKKGEWVVLGLGTGRWIVSVTAEGYSPASQDANVKQLQRNPAVSIILRKLKQSAKPILQDKSSFSLFDEGNRFFKEKKYDEAISAYEHFLEKNPKASQVYFNIGNCYKLKGDYERAKEEYNKVLEGIKKDQENLSGNKVAAKALAGIGECYLKNDDYENAQKYLKEAVDIYPKDESLAYNVGEIYFSNNKIDEAIRYFELSKQINPEWGKSRLKLGYAYLNKGDFEKAKENLRKFIELEPDSPQVQTAQNMLDYLEKQKK